MASYFICDDDVDSHGVNKHSALSAWLAVRDMQRNGSRNVVILNHDGKAISPEELAFRAAIEKGE